jgi:sigma-54 dependent transcriptional regulator, acetoin dehydrogenase operon transcriptional activator AcoR
MALADKKITIQKMINSFANAANVEIAVFDESCQIAVCTEPYLQHKGSHVHIPSIEEVLSQGNVVVNEPGSMPSCAGCRFKDHCPATIELLSCILTNHLSFGVVCLTSFTQEGHDRISSHLDIYLDLLAEISDLIASVLMQGSGMHRLAVMDETLKTLMMINRDPLLAVDRMGMITHGNHAAMNLFSSCNLLTTSLHQIIHPTVVRSILDGNALSDYTITSEAVSGVLSALPVRINETYSGSVLQIRQAVSEPPDLPECKLIQAPAEEAVAKIIGQSPSITALKQSLPQFSCGTSPVLITGETGTGKELFARAIHDLSPRKNFPFVAINCASIPETLFESELFGYEEGSFTGAKKGGKMGRLEYAQEGTVFLDEIGEMPLYLQSKLLRVLQEYSIERVGSLRSIILNVRIIAATNQSLEKLVEAGKIRTDLYYRLNVIPLYLPPLRERQEDVPELCRFFLQKYNQRLRKNIRHFSDETLMFLKAYPWPGNVRELENIVEYTVNMAQSEQIQFSDLPQRVRQFQAIQTTDSLPLSVTARSSKKLREHEAVLIRELLAHHGYDGTGKKLAAASLGISVRTLYRKMDQLNISHK